MQNTLCKLSPGGEKTGSPLPCRILLRSPHLICSKLTVFTSTYSNSEYHHQNNRNINAIFSHAPTIRAAEQKVTGH